MVNMNENRKNLEFQLTRLKNLDKVTLKPLNSHNQKQELVPNNIISEWNTQIIPFVLDIANKYSPLVDFISDITIYNLSNVIKEILEIVDELIVVINDYNKENKIRFSQSFENLKEKIIHLNSSNIYFKEDISDLTQPDHNTILYFITNSFANNSDFYREEYKKLNDSSKYEFLTKLIFAYNRMIDGTFDPFLLDEINNFLLKNVQESILEQEYLLKKKEKETLIRIENAKNESTIIEFKKKADGLRFYILSLNIFISLLFISIIFIFIFKYFTHPKELTEIIYSITLVIAISSFLAFLIKEKNILSNQYHNYMKCHTELVALSTYIVDIDKIKSEDLKIRLAEKYFTGYSQENKHDNDSSLNIESINKIILLLKDIQKK